jgi:hypothetical protein
MSIPHSPLLAGAEASSASARSPNFRVAAETRGFLSFETEAWSDFVCPARAATKAPAGNTPNAKIIAIANPTRTVHLWQITFRESIVETAKSLRLAACVERRGEEEVGKLRGLRPETSELEPHHPNFIEVT